MLRIVGAALLCTLIASPCLAQANNQFTSSGNRGSGGNTSRATGNQTAQFTGQVGAPTGKNSPAIAPTLYGALAPGGLQQTSLSSFVKDAGGSAEQIYGDEGSMGPPPYFGFDQSHRIGTGLPSSQLSTGHASTLPSAWGYAYGTGLQPGQGGEPGESSYSGGYNSGASADGLMPTIGQVLTASPGYNLSTPNNAYSGGSGF